MNFFMKFLKAYAVGLIFVLAVSCSKKQASENGSKTPTFLLITDELGEKDESFLQAAFSGVLKFYGESWDNQTSRGVLYNVMPSNSAADYVPNLKKASEAKRWDVIAVAGFTFADSVGEVAKAYPEQKYMAIDVTSLDLPNVAQYAFAEHEGSYLVGVAAALKAQQAGLEAPRFGFIGGMASGVITRFEIGYVQGLLSIFPNSEIVDFYAESWGAPELARPVADEWFDNGVYTIYAAAGGTGIGAIEAASNHRMQGSDVWAIGVDSDQYDVGLYAPSTSSVLTSMLKKVETASYDTLVAVRENKFKGGDPISLGITDDGVGFTTTNPEMDDEIVAQLNKVRDDIVNKRIRVLGTYREALAANVAPRGLKAKDD